MFGPQILDRTAALFGLFLILAVGACGSDAESVGAIAGELAPPSGIVSDDFHAAALDTQLWQLVDPQGGGSAQVVGAGTSDAQLLLSVPAGTSHNAWKTNTSLRLMQPAADVDFEIEAKFESEPTQRYQGHGLLVEEAPAKYVRFDVYHDGSSLRVFVATFNNGAATVHANGDPIATGPTTYLRLGRTVDQWLAEYSYDGVTWLTAASFTHTLTVSEVGVFASNYKPNPAYTAVVDYFFDNAARIDPEDPPQCEPTDLFALTAQATNGSIVRTPDLSSYGCGDVVTLTAQPDVGATFVGWGGALSGTTNPTTLTINADTTVTASFLVDGSPPQVSNLNVTPGDTSAVASWQTDELSIGVVEFGLTQSYELGSVASSTLSTAHSVTLPGLTEGLIYHYRLSVEDGLGNSATGTDATFTTTTSGGGTGGTGGGGGEPPLSGIVSDDFHAAALDTQLWQLVDPQGGGSAQVVGAGTSDAQLLLSVPAGTPHNAWKTNTSLRLMQPAADVDFEIEAKFESEPTQGYQGHGLLVEEAPAKYVRFDVYHDGSSLRVFVATFNNGAATVHANGDPIATGPTTYLRLGRTVDQWLAEYSYDGVTWLTAASFTHTLTVSEVGVFASNYKPNPAYTAVVDYFFDNAARIDPEDPPQCEPTDLFALTAQATNGSIVRAPDLSSYGCGDVVTLTAQPDVGATFVGWGGALSGTTNPTTLTINADTTVTASFLVDGSPPQVSNLNVTPGDTSAAASWQTDELSIGVVEFGLTQSYELGSVASSTLSTAHSVTLPGLTEGLTYHYRIWVEDGLGNSAAGTDATFTTTISGCSLVLTTQATNGSIVRAPDLSSYGCGDVVTLTAQPDVGATFVGWGGALSGTTNPTTLTINADTTVTASFLVDGSPPQVSNLNVTPGDTSAVASWQTDELSIGVVEFGLTQSYELGSVASSTLSTAHSVTLPGLTEGLIYHYRLSVEDGLGNSATGTDATFTTTTSGGGTGGTGGGGGEPPLSGIVSDDFHAAALDTQLWQLVDPQGGGSAQVVGAGTSDAQLLLSVPAGTSHNAWKTNTSLRLMQPAADVDFEIEAKFESEPTQGYQGHGLLVEEAPAKYVRFDVYHDGSSLRVFVATFNNGAATVHANGDPIATGPTTYLRLGRTVDQWLAEYSYDGVTWLTAASFTHTLTVSEVGVFASNYKPNPAYTAVVDYFFDNAARIDPEDPPPCLPADQFTVDMAVNGPGVVSRDPDQSTYTCGEVVMLTAQPGAGAVFLNWTGAPSTTANPLVLTVGADATITAHFDLDVSPPQVSNLNVTTTGSSATIGWQTNEDSIGSVEFGLTQSYELGSVASSTLSTAHSVTLPGLTEGEFYHYRITVEDSLGNTATGADAIFAATAGGPAIDVWYGDSQSFGALGNPQWAINVLGQVSDPDGVSALTYSLNGGPSQNLSIGPYRRIAEPGDFNVELDYLTLSPGTNTIEITAEDGLGFQSVKTVTVDYSAGNVWPANYSIDWSTVADITDVAQVVDGRWSIVDGALRNDLLRYDRLVAIGDVTWTDYEVTVPVTIHAVSPVGFDEGGPGVGVMLKWPGHSDWTGDQPTWGWYPGGGGGWLDIFEDGTTSLLLEDWGTGVFRRETNPRNMAFGTTYIWKVRVESGPGTNATYSIKVWDEASPEPASWDIVDSEDADVSGGSVLFITHFTDVSFGNVVIAPL